MTEPASRSTPAIGLFAASSIVVANTIGTGVFTSLGFQAVDIQSGFSLLLLWVIGGVFALCGALSYGELSAMMPRSGGEYHFLSKIYHPAVGFLSGWLSVTVGFAAPIALAAMAFGQYFARVVPGVSPLLAALVTAIVISAIHAQNARFGRLFQNGTTILKVLLIVLFIACGLFVSAPQSMSFLPSAADFEAISSAPFAISLVYVTYSYSGWNAAVYLAGEVDDPQRNVPRALLLGTCAITLLYVLLNFVFLYTTPIDNLAGELEVGYIAANAIFGEGGARLMAALIAFGLISSISAMVWAGPRVTQAIGEDFPVFRVLSKQNRQGVPHISIWLQLAVVIALVLTSTFETVLTYLGFMLALSSMLTVAGVFVMRVTHPDLPRPYRTWGYPLTPLIFIGISVWILAFVLTSQPSVAIAGLATIALGVPVYLRASRSPVTSRPR